jgi:hypothetical protein
MNRLGKFDLAVAVNETDHMLGGAHARATLVEYGGIAAAASRQAARGLVKNYPNIWRVKARGEGRLRNHPPSHKDGQVVRDTRADALRAWSGVAAALAQSDKGEDRDLARQVLEFVNTMPVRRERAYLAQRGKAPLERGLER